VNKEVLFEPEKFGKQRRAALKHVLRHKIDEELFYYEELQEQLTEAEDNVSIYS